MMDSNGVGVQRLPALLLARRKTAIASTKRGRFVFSVNFHDLKWGWQGTEQWEQKNASNQSITNALVVNPKIGLTYLPYPVVQWLIIY